MRVAKDNYLVKSNQLHSILIIDSLLLAVVLSISTGPVFFLLVQLAIEKGFWPATSLAAGVWCSDVIYITLVFLGLSYVSENPNFSFYVGLVGGIILILFGLISIAAKPSPKKQAVIGTKDYFLLFLKGMAVNVFNPFLFVFWVGVVGRTIEQGYTFLQRILYFLLLLVAVALMDELKIYFAERISHKIKPVHLLWLSRISGVVLVAFGLEMLWSLI